MKKLLLMIPLVLFLTGCNKSLPSTAQINLRLPEAIRQCPGIPVSPGKRATEKQRAVYIIALYYTAKKCKGNLGAVDRIYKVYRKRLERIANR